METTRRSGPVPRAWAGTNLGSAVAAAVITILATRAYLLLTGYPTIGGDTFHIAHSVWGGLLLILGLTLTLAAANPWVPWAASLLGGVGAGLFLDEVGKFITADNDYFFPLAAPIAYALIASGAVLTWWLGRSTRQTPRAHLYAAREISGAGLDGPLTARRRLMVLRHLDAARELGDERDHAIADALQELLEATRIGEDECAPSRAARARGWVRHWERRLFPVNRLRRLTRAGLAFVALLGAIAGPMVLGVALWNRNADRPFSFGNGVLDGHPGNGTWIAACISTVVGGVAGVFAWRASRNLRDQSIEPLLALRAGSTALLILLIGSNMLTAYFNQFLVFIDASLQAAVLGMLTRFSRRSTRDEDSP